MTLIRLNPTQDPRKLQVAPGRQGVIKAGFILSAYYISRVKFTRESRQGSLVQTGLAMSRMDGKEKNHPKENAAANN